MTALWTTPLPSRFILGRATTGLLKCVLDSSGTHPSTASRGPERFESCPLKCTHISLEDVKRLRGGKRLWRLRVGEWRVNFSAGQVPSDYSEDVHFLVKKPLAILILRRLDRSR